MKAKPIRLTQAHRAEFRRHLADWQDRLNLRDWRISLSETRAKPTVLAEVSRRLLEDRLATIRLSEVWDENNPPTPELLEEVALHELLHIFLHELLEFAGTPGVNDSDVASQEHRVVITLARLLVSLRGKRR